MMMSSGKVSRVDKVRKALMREMAEAIRVDLGGPELEGQVVSVTDVDVSQDLRHAKFFLSILADETKKLLIMDYLLTNLPKLRYAIGKRVQLRFVPEIKLELDNSLERGTRVYHIIEKIARGEID